MTAEILNLIRAATYALTEENYFGSSVNSKFFPVNLFTSIGLRHFDKVFPEQTTVEPFTFKKMVQTTNYGRGYDFFLAALSGNRQGGNFSYTIDGTRKIMRISFGIVQTGSSEILSLLCVKSCTPNFEASNLILLIAKEFSTDPNYRNVYRRYKKEYLDVLVEEGVDVLESTSLGIVNMVYPETALPDLSSYMDLISFGNNFKFSHIKGETLETLPVVPTPPPVITFTTEEITPVGQAATVAEAFEEEFEDVLRTFEEGGNSATYVDEEEELEEEEEYENWEEILGQVENDDEEDDDESDFDPELDF